MTSHLKDRISQCIIYHWRGYRARERPRWVFCIPLAIFLDLFDASSYLTVQSSANVLSIFYVLASCNYWWIWVNDVVYTDRRPHGLVRFNTVANTRACVNHFERACTVMSYDSPHGPPIQMTSLDAAIVVSMLLTLFTS